MTAAGGGVGCGVGGGTVAVIDALGAAGVVPGGTGKGVKGVGCGAGWTDWFSIPSAVTDGGVDARFTVDLMGGTIFVLLCADGRLAICGLREASAASFFF